MSKEPAPQSRFFGVELCQRQSCQELELVEGLGDCLAKTSGKQDTLGSTSLSLAAFRYMIEVCGTTVVLRIWWPE